VPAGPVKVDLADDEALAKPIPAPRQKVDRADTAATT
jgi:hypothetical protein